MLSNEFGNLGVMATRMKLLSTVVLIGLIAGCSKPPELPPEPNITGHGFNKTTIQSGVDTLIVRIDYEDGDGNLGTPDGQSATNAFVKDTRFPAFPATEFTIPELNVTGVPQAISGSVWFTFEPIAVPICTPGKDMDTLRFEIYIKDQDGNLSNTITTDEVVLDCN